MNTQASRNWDATKTALLGLGVAALIAGMIVVEVALLGTVQSLGQLFKIDSTLSTIIALSAAIACFGHGLVAAFSKSNAMRFWNGISAVVWLVITVMLSITFSALSVTGVTAQMTIAEMQSKLAESAIVLPYTVIYVGQIAYSALPAIALITLSVSIFGAIAMMLPVADARFATLGQVAQSAGITTVVVVAAVYSGLHMFTFGAVTLNVDPFTAAASAVLAELTFIAAFKRGIDTRRGHHLVVALLAVAYALLTNWLEGQAVLITEARSRDAALVWIQADPTASFAASLYSVAGVLFAALWAVVEWQTARAEAGDVGEGLAQWTLRKADEARAFKAALNAGRTTALPPPKTATLPSVHEAKGRLDTKGAEGANTEGERARNPVPKSGSHDGRKPEK